MRRSIGIQNDGQKGISSFKRFGLWQSECCQIVQSHAYLPLSRSILHDVNNVLHGGWLDLTKCASGVASVGCRPGRDPHQGARHELAALRRPVAAAERSAGGAADGPHAGRRLALP